MYYDPGGLSQGQKDSSTSESLPMKETKLINNKKTSTDAEVAFGKV